MRTSVSIALALVLAGALSTPAAMAARAVVTSNVTIFSSGGATTVQQSNSCSPGVSGYLYQSVLVLFGGATYSVTQSTTCP